MKQLKQICGRILKDIRYYGITGVILLVYYFIMQAIFHAFCPLVIFTGFPCAGCGLTRSLLFVITGQFARAFYLNPMIFPIIIFAVYCGWQRYIKGSRVKWFYPVLGALTGTLILFYCFRMYLYFPDRVPYVYGKNNVFADKIPGYRQLIQNLIHMVHNYRL